MLWNLSVQLSRKPWDDDSQLTIGSQELGQVADVELVCAEIVIRVETHDRVEVVVGERQSCRPGM